MVDMNSVQDRCYVVVTLSFVVFFTCGEATQVNGSSCSVYTGILFSKNCFKVTKFDKIYFFVL